MEGDGEVEGDGCEDGVVDVRVVGRGWQKWSGEVGGDKDGVAG